MLQLKVESISSFPPDIVLVFHLDESLALLQSIFHSDTRVKCKTQIRIWHSYAQKSLIYSSYLLNQGQTP